MSIGKIAEFNVRSDNWRLYVERLEQYFLVNKIANELKVPTLITVIGLECYELLVDLCTPDKPSNKTFEQLTSVLERHLQPKPSILAERYKFRQRKQAGGETVADYVAALKKLSKTCEFGNWLEDSLRDQLVCGIHCDSIRQRLFQEEKLDFAKAYRLAVSMEAAEKNAAVVESHAEVTSAGTGVAACQAMAAWRSGAAAARSGSTALATRSGSAATRPGLAGGGRAGSAAAPAAGRNGSAGAAVRTARGQPGQRCRACGGQHDQAQCKFADYVCRVCNQPGHLRRVCPIVKGHYNVEAAVMTSDPAVQSDGSDEFQIL